LVTPVHLVSDNCARTGANRAANHSAGTGATQLVADNGTRAGTNGTTHQSARPGFCLTTAHQEGGRHETYRGKSQHKPFHCVISVFADSFCLR